jgi:hypothetical protein
MRGAPITEKITGNYIYVYFFIHIFAEDSSILSKWIILRSPWKKRLPYQDRIFFGSIPESIDLAGDVGPYLAV